jgi:hypothetical protein
MNNPTTYQTDCVGLSQTTDPPPDGGYTYQDPPVYSYPFYNDPNTNTLNDTILAEASTTTLSFYDSPADACISGLSGPSVGYNMIPPADKLACPPSDLAPSNSYQLFTTELVGVTPAYMAGAPCSPATCVGLGGFTWLDNFNGIGSPNTGTGGVFDFAIDDSDLTVDPNTGTGGIIIVSEFVGAPVPEPSSIELFTTGVLCWLTTILWKNRTVRARYRLIVHWLLAHRTTV